MKKAAYAAAMAIVILVAAGCATTTFREEPKPPDRGTLLIGQVQVEIKDWPSREMNGIHRRNVQVYLYDTGKKKQNQITSHGDGAFYLVFTNVKKEIYIQGFIVKGSDRGGTSTISVEYGKRVILYPGKVNNMGRILCTVQTTGIRKMSTKTTSYDTVQDVKVDYEDIRQWFQLTFPDSAWNDKEWERVLHYK
jgi:hypothetical protein